MTVWSPCRRVRAALWRRADDALPIEVDLRVAEHLRTCERCAEQARRLDLLGAWFEALPEPPEERLDVEELVGRIGRELDAQGPVERLATARRVRTFVTRAAALLLVFAGAFLLLGRFKAEPIALGPEPSEFDPIDVSLVQPEETPEAQTEADLPQRPVLVGTRLVLAPPPEVEAGAAARLEADRATLRAALLAAEPLLRERASGATASAAQSAAFIDEVERSCAALTQSGRLLVRLVEDELQGPNPRVASAAARYVGARGDRAALHALERAAFAVPPARRHDWFVALAESGERGSAALLTALLDPDSCGPASAALAAVSGARRAQLLELALPRARGRVRAALFDSLLGCGPDAVEVALRMHATAELSREDALWILRVDDRGGERLAALPPVGEDDRAGVDLLLEHARRTRAAALLPQVGALARSTPFAPVARAALVGWPTSDGAALAVDLWRESRDEPLAAAAFVVAAPGAFEALARQQVEPRDRLDPLDPLDNWARPQDLGAFLVASGVPDALPALFVLAADASLPVAQREFLLDAIADLGQPEDAYALEQLRRAFEGFLAAPRPTPDARRLAARTLLTVRTLAGADAALDLLGAFSPATLRRARATLDPERPDSVALVQLERALERATSATPVGRNDSSSRSTP